MYQIDAFHSHYFDRPPQDAIENALEQLEVPKIKFMDKKLRTMNVWFGD